MSSIQSFIRQRSQANTIFSAPVAPPGPGPVAAGCYYVFVAGPGNYVGNYPPGYMQAVDIPTGKGSLIRDMGKTIKAVIGSSDLPVPVLAGATAGFFRQIQFIDPQAAVSATGSTTFGVGTGSQGAGTLPSAGNAGDAGYGTYYIPIIVDGTLATSNGVDIATVPNPYLSIGGQM